MHCNEDEEMDEEVCFLTCSRRVQAAAAAVEDLSYTHKGSRPTEVLCDLVSHDSFFHSLLAPVKEAINYINTQHHASSILYVTCEYKPPVLTDQQPPLSSHLRVTLAESVLV